MKDSTISRRKFLVNMSAATAFTMVPLNHLYQRVSKSKKPNSKVGGVQLGLTTYVLHGK